MGDGIVTWEELIPKLASERVKGLWFAGGYKTNWIDEPTAESIVAEIPLIIVQDMFRSPLYDRATFQLPGVSFAERGGSYVNHADRLQSFSWAIRPPAGVMSEGHLLWPLTGHEGLYQPRKVMEHVASEIAYFAEAARPVPPTGIDLKLNQLAGA